MLSLLLSMTLFVNIVNLLKIFGLMVKKETCERG